NRDISNVVLLMPPHLTHQTYMFFSKKFYAVIDTIIKVKKIEPHKFNYIDLIQHTKNKNKINIMNDQQIKTIIINDHFKVKLNGSEEYYFEDMDYDNFRRNFFKDKSFFI